MVRLPTMGIVTAPRLPICPDLEALNACDANAGTPASATPPTCILFATAAPALACRACVIGLRGRGLCSAVRCRFAADASSFTHSGFLCPYSRHFQHCPVNVPLNVPVICPPCPLPFPPASHPLPFAFPFSPFPFPPYPVAPPLLSPPPWSFPLPLDFADVLLYAAFIHRMP